MDLLYVALVVGLLVGGVLSLLVGLNSKATPTAYIKSVFGLSSYNLILDGTVLVLAVCFLFLATMSGLVRDLRYPTTKPVNFTIETLLMAILPASVFLMMTPLRGYPITSTTFTEFTVLVVKFGLLHILLQFSGFYSNIFAPK